MEWAVYSLERSLKRVIRPKKIMKTVKDQRLEIRSDQSPSRGSFSASLVKWIYISFIPCNVYLIKCPIVQITILKLKDLKFINVGGF